MKFLFDAIARNNIPFAIEWIKNTSDELLEKYRSKFGISLWELAVQTDKPDIVKILVNRKIPLPKFKYIGDNKISHAVHCYEGYLDFIKQNSPNAGARNNVLAILIIGGLMTPAQVKKDAIDTSAFSLFLEASESNPKKKVQFSEKTSAYDGSSSSPTHKKLKTSS